LAALHLQLCVVLLEFLVFFSQLSIELGGVIGDRLHFNVFVDGLFEESVEHLAGGLGLDGLHVLGELLLEHVVGRDLVVGEAEAAGEFVLGGFLDEVDLVLDFFELVGDVGVLLAGELGLDGLEDLAGDDVLLVLLLEVFEVLHEVLLVELVLALLVLVGLDQRDEGLHGAAHLRLSELQVRLLPQVVPRQRHRLLAKRLEKLVYEVLLGRGEVRERHATLEIVRYQLFP